jgi:hypothetical protein
VSHPEERNAASEKFRTNYDWDNPRAVNSASTRPRWLPSSILTGGLTLTLTHPDPDPDPDPDPEIIVQSNIGSLRDVGALKQFC